MCRKRYPTCPLLRLRSGVFVFYLPNRNPLNLRTSRFASLRRPRATYLAVVTAPPVRKPLTVCGVLERDTSSQHPPRSQLNDEYTHRDGSRRGCESGDAQESGLFFWCPFDLRVEGFYSVARAEARARGP